MGIAYPLDPNTDPNTFIDTDEADRSNKPIIGYLYSFATEKRAWPPEAKRNNEEEAPRHWWESHRVTPAHDALFHLADLVLSIPTSSSSSSERAWTIHSF
ncbi:hypothetical protein PC129_g20342 [Phytophthora cactorum]|uniref:HAT C-terminal dimerisation domain-containing protein n=1 Tax=Phytophthora cactorum TaxID=29920 RepID=A0A8T1H9D6_9STRA|nr:hypothetical protein PC114_g12388 [Phytophthora cactorum]KAG2973562.1 hypothetical protein PC119_g22887 [Phytophthora cactorum]KAG3027248.1 hypothetical protein PC120_g5539 [Phytophthora cactorum]KAG3130723.1 hypothetical protein C6341_g23640 [Phytophthora cactorum]KAG3195814.1 hypothetical protein PC128_g8185 [Phytophthora cactorum]